MTILNVVFNLILIPGSDRSRNSARSACDRHVARERHRIARGDLAHPHGPRRDHFPRSMSWAPDWTIILRLLFRFGLPAGMQGVAMNIAVMLLRFIGSLEHSAEAQAAYAVGYLLFSLITWTSVGLMGAAAAVAGQNLGAGHPERAVLGVRVAARYG